MKYWIIGILFFISVGMTRRICDHNVTDYTPITDLVNLTFSGYTGGLYPDGNDIPAAHFANGMTHATQIIPRNETGQADAHGKIGLLVLGYSTAAMTGRTFSEMIRYAGVDTALQVIIGAQGGQDLRAMIKPETTYWDSVDAAIQNKGLTREQVQIIWMSSGDIAAYTLPFAEQTQHGIDAYQQVLLRIRQLFPAVQIVFISDRPYAGFIGKNEQPGPKELAEPSGYYHSWTVKWLIEKQIQQVAGFTYAELPFIDWGPTLWTNGTLGDKRGYTWDCLDAGKGGIHATSKGRMKEAARLYNYFTKHPYTTQLFSTLSPSLK